MARFLRAIVGLPTLDDESVRARLRARFGEADEEDLVLFDDLLGIRDPRTPSPNIDPDARRRRLSALVKVAAIARGTPAIYIIEDAHWIDEVSDSMLADFITVIPQTHSMVLLTYRPEFRGALSRLSGSQMLTLAPLSQSESASLASELLGGDPSVSEMAATVVERAAGNPFFAEEIVRDLSERGVLCGQRGAYVCRADIADVGVPATLQATISARIDRLNPTAKRALCAAAVIGMRFDTDLLASMDVDPALEESLAGRTDRPGEIHPTGRIRIPSSTDPDGRVRIAAQVRSRRVAPAIGGGDRTTDPASVDENAALIAEHLEAAAISARHSSGTCVPALGWRAATSQRRRLVGGGHGRSRMRYLPTTRIGCRCASHRAPRCVQQRFVSAAAAPTRASRNCANCAPLQAICGRWRSA